MRSWADPFTSVAATLSITTSAATTAILHRGIFTFAFLHLDRSSTEGSEISQKPVRNQSETGQTQPLSLSLAYSLTLLPETPTPTPIPISTTTTATASASGTTVSFPDRFRTAQAYFAPKFEIEPFTHGSLLSLLDLLLLLVLPPHPLLLHHHYHYSYPYYY